ncbi:MAG: helix-turn-helix domain-containing protein [Ruminococcus sp.]|nr:helix-turn-helix domain-containing protein [Ruminococcus sp.]
MDNSKTGKIIRQLRTEKKLTQKQLADLIGVSDKAVSKWETGKGYPDISLFSALADVFGADVRNLLMGNINKNEKEIGNMKRLKFYVCEDCGNIITSTSEAAISCCGKKLSPLTPRAAEENEKLTVENIDGNLYISSPHPMTKEHYISFVAYTVDSTAMIFKQYPEWNLQVTLPPFRSGRLVWYCNKCGLLYQNLRRKS